MCLATIYCLVHSNNSLCLNTIRSICCCILVLAVHSNIRSLCLNTIRSICCCILVLTVHSNNSLCLYTIRSICCCILVLAVPSNQFQILRGYMVLLKPPILVHSCHAHWYSSIHHVNGTMSFQTELLGTTSGCVYIPLTLRLRVAWNETSYIRATRQVQEFENVSSKT